ncbi:coiled-coil domain-containing protein 15-like isoform X1 [Mya arenaria]|uniref:coiled-coil domain-containing protein 15-like isoform X1 n=1 Tax=Mya arenaria TaxID=6604 RepID=UPI0022E07B33|nr:coiled-coil domain-containing protein 15-like isoform X1 [Mya arenaria]
MASKGKRENLALRKIAKPVISTDVMGNRNVEVRAVGAWVQVESPYTEAEGVVGAVEEERRLRQLQQEKQARLRHFQAEVKKRVNALDRMRKQNQLETNFQASEQERRVVGQSAFSFPDSTKKDTSLVRPHTALAVSKSVRHKESSDRPKSGYDHEAFSDQTNQVHEHVRQAKKSLVSRQVITENYVKDDLPGGMWKISRTRDDLNPAKNPSSRYTVDGEEFDILDEDLIEKVKVVNNKVYQESQDGQSGSPEDSDKENEVVSRSVQFHDDHTDHRGQRNSDYHTDHRGQKNSDYHTDHRGQRNRRQETVNRVPNIYEGVKSEEEKRRSRAQQAMYRRLFMDKEREQVKENLRRQEHRKRIVRLKKEAEAERQEEERVSQALVEPRNPVTGETSTEVLDREQQEREFIRRTIREHERRQQKSKETERYIEALRQQLKDKVRRKGVELPPLCCCGESIWDTNPETCANNCVFYKNPKEYGRALQAMLDSSELCGS